MSKNHSMTTGLAVIKNALYGALNNDDILNAVIPYGYTADVLRNEGIAKHELAESLALKVIKEYGEQFSATEKTAQLFGAYQPAYMDIIRLARIGLKNMSGALHSLRATGSRNRSLTGFIKDARVLYTNLLEQPDYLEAVKRFGITEENLRLALDDINRLESSYHEFLKEKGEAQSSTIARDQAYDDLYNWYSDFRAVARIALKKQPQLLEKMGIVVKNN